MKLVSHLLDSPDISALFAKAARLPARYGIGFDERLIEYPWLLAHLPRGRVLDAGSSLNHVHVLDRVLPRLEQLHVVTLAPEPVAYFERGISYVYGDLRDIPYRDGYFDAVVALSTLEHVGMDTSIYGVTSPRAADPSLELRRAVGELLRVLRRGGTFLATVPYGAREDHGWFRQFDRVDVDTLVSLTAPRPATVAVYRYTESGWQKSSLEEAAHERYHDHHSDRSMPSDRAAAARAVACLSFGPLT